MPLPYWKGGWRPEKPVSQFAPAQLPGKLPEGSWGRVGAERVISGRGASDNRSPENKCTIYQTQAFITQNGKR